MLGELLEAQLQKPDLLLKILATRLQGLELCSQLGAQLRTLFHRIERRGLLGAQIR